MHDDLVTIGLFTDAMAAETARGLLVAHGLRAFVMDTHVNSLTPQLLSPVIGVRVQVPRSEAKAALELLEGLEAATPDVTGDDVLSEEDELEEGDGVAEDADPGHYSADSGEVEYSYGDDGPDWDETSPTGRMVDGGRSRTLLLALAVAAVALFVMVSLL